MQKKDSSLSFTLDAESNVMDLAERIYIYLSMQYQRCMHFGIDKVLWTESTSDRDKEEYYHKLMY